MPIEYGVIAPQAMCAPAIDTSCGLLAYGKGHTPYEQSAGEMTYIYKAITWRTQMNRKTYIGDGVYVEFDRGTYILTTSDGVNIIDTIYLDRELIDNLVRFVECMETGE